MPEESVQYQTCDVCGRTILRGERVREYMTPQGDEVAVCALCVARAEAAGWLPAELAGPQAESVATRRRPGVALRARLGRVAERARDATGSRREQGVEAAAESPEPSDDPPAGEQAAGRPAQPKRKPRTPRKQPTQAQERPARRRRAPRTPERVMRRAVERFNASPESRKVAGLIRSLGEPNVAIRARGAKALVTVAWELSWYQWEVDADGGAEGQPGPVREVAKGKEVTELPEDARDWNAAAGEDGTLRLGP